MKHKPDMLDKAASHARSAMKQAQMKGLDTEAVAGQFMVQALMANFAIDQSRAAALALHCAGYALEMLQRDDLENALDHEVEQIRQTQAELRSAPDRPAWLTPVAAAVDAVTAKLSKLDLRGSTWLRR